LFSSKRAAADNQDWIKYEATNALHCSFHGP
jgi:hypothetical protein